MTQRASCAAPLGVGSGAGASADADAADEEARTPTVAEVYERWFDYVWRTLRAMGVGPAAIDDAVQDVFVVVQRRLGEFEGRASVKTWLFAIVRRVAAGHRRKRSRTARREPPLVAEPPSPSPSPREAAERAEAAEAVLAILAHMSEEQRAVFALVDIEGLSAPEAAEALSVKLNTVYSRLRSARAVFERELARRRARDGRSS